MPRPSNRTARRAELADAFIRALAQHGLGGATVARVASEAGVAPGLIHHHFEDRADLIAEALQRLRRRAAERRRAHDVEPDPVDGWLEAALALDATADREAARAWVGLLAEALGDESLRQRVARHLDGELRELVERSNGPGSAGNLDRQSASALLAFTLGSLVLGAFQPRRTAGFAAPAARVLRAALAEK